MRQARLRWTSAQLRPRRPWSKMRLLRANRPNCDAIEPRDLLVAGHGVRFEFADSRARRSGNFTDGCSTFGPTRLNEIASGQKTHRRAIRRVEPATWRTKMLRSIRTRKAGVRSAKLRLFLNGSSESQKRRPGTNLPAALIYLAPIYQFIYGTDLYMSRWA